MFTAKLDGKAFLQTSKYKRGAGGQTTCSYKTARYHLYERKKKERIRWHLENMGKENPNVTTGYLLESTV